MTELAQLARLVFELTRKEVTERFGAVLYHLGNDPRFHGEIYRTLLEVPGILVLHEYVIHHLVQGLTLRRGDLEGYVETMRYCYGASGQAIARIRSASPEISIGSSRRSITTIAAE